MNRLHRRRLLGALGLLVYGTAVLALPLLHGRHHRDDHTHSLEGTRWQRGEVFGGHADYALTGEGEGASDGGGDRRTVAAHRVFDEDLASLGLVEAGHYGIVDVDCTLARYTLVECPDEAAPAHTFGDELLAHLPHAHHHPRDFDPTHGAHSIEHLGSSLLSAQTFVLPPPVRPAQHLPPVAIAERTGHAPPPRQHSRGPPPSSIVA